MTPKMKEFIEHNSKFKIIEGRWLNERNRDSLCLDDRLKLRYKFENGSIRTLHPVDIESAIEYSPVWKL